MIYLVSFYYLNFLFLTHIYFKRCYISLSRQVHPSLLMYLRIFTYCYNAVYLHAVIYVYLHAVITHITDVHVAAMSMIICLTDILVNPKTPILNSFTMVLCVNNDLQIIWACLTFTHIYCKICQSYFLLISKDTNSSNTFTMVLLIH